jgi:hypothetical protein
MNGALLGPVDYDIAIAAPSADHAGVRHLRGQTERRESQRCGNQPSATHS